MLRYWHWSATQDTLVRPERSRRLVEAWGGAARLELLDGVDHNTIHTHPQYWPLIDEFLAERSRSLPPHTAK